MVASDDGVVVLEELGVVLELELGVVEFMLPAEELVLLGVVEVEELLLGVVEVLLGTDVSVDGVVVL